MGPWGGDRGCDRGGAEGQGRRTGALLLLLLLLLPCSPHDYTCAHHGHAALSLSTPPSCAAPIVQHSIARKRAMHRSPLFLRAYLLPVGIFRSVALACRQSPPLPASQLLQRFVFPWHLQSSSSLPSPISSSSTLRLLFRMILFRMLSILSLSPILFILSTCST